MRPWAKVAFWTVVAGQLVFLLAFIGWKEVDLRTGTEVVLQTVPVDPRSLLQGDYAILDYAIASLPENWQDAERGAAIFVILREGPEVWEAARYENLRPAPGEPYIEGRVDRPGHLDFGIGTYFVPEGTGRIIENAQDVKVVINVDSDGSAIIERVLVDGRPFDSEAETR